MTDAATRAAASAAPGGGHRGNTLGLRLALAFLGVALAAVALLAVLTAVFSAVDVSSLASRQRDELAGAVAVAAASAWQQDQGWAGADLTPVLELAQHTGVQLQVRTRAAAPSRPPSGFAAAAGPVDRSPCWCTASQDGSVVRRPDRVRPRRRRQRPADRAAAGHRRGGRARRPARARHRPRRSPGGSPAPSPG